MSTFYWVDGDGNWDAFDTTNWALSSGGAGGAGVPTEIDDVVFDANSSVGATPFTVSVTGDVSAPSTCKNFTAAALSSTATLNLISSSRIALFGTILLPASDFVWSGVAGCLLFLRSTSLGNVITTNGVALTNTGIRLDGGGEWELGSALVWGVNSTFTITNGSFATEDFNMSGSVLRVDENATKTLNFGASTITLSGTTGPINFIDSHNFTFIAGTSNIVCTANNPRFIGGSKNFHNLSFNSVANGITTIEGTNTFNDFLQVSRSATGRRLIALTADQTINGLLTFGAGNTSVRRMFVFSDSIGVSRTLTLNGTLATLSDVDFRDIAANGTVSTPWTGTRLGDALGNANITFAVPKTVYRVGTGAWSATQWSTSSGGAVNVNNFPLAQDTMIFDANTTTGTHTIDGVGWNLGTLDCSALTSAVTIASGTTVPNFYSNITLDSNVTLSGAGVWTLAGQGSTQSITSDGRTFTQPLTVNSPSGTVKFLEALTVSNTLTMTNGTVELKDGATSTVTTFQTSGTTQMFLQSTLAGSQATLSQASGTVSVSNLTIQDINATGGAKWNAFVTNENVDGGNNTGWDFFFQLGRYIYTRRKNKRILL